MSDPLTNVRRAARIRRAAEQRYTQAICAAVDQGCTHAAVAAAAGVTRQAVTQHHQRQSRV